MEIQPNAFAKIIENIHDGLYIMDQNRIITYWNKAAERITGFSAVEVIGRSCDDNILTHFDSEGHKLYAGWYPLAKALGPGTMHESKVYLHHKNGQRIPVSVRVTPLTETNGHVVGGVEIFTDISNQVGNEIKLRELEKMALLDPLTQLANRAWIERELESRAEEYYRYKIPFGIFFMDIDHFKAINDIHGHVAGDKVLKFAADTFTANARPFDLYGRWGGEEFIGIVRNMTPAALHKLGNRLRVLIEQADIIHEEKKLHVTMSMGATLIRQEDTTASLAKRAATLLHQSKARGRNCVTYS